MSQPATIVQSAPVRPPVALSEPANDLFTAPALVLGVVLHCAANKETFDPQRRVCTHAWAAVARYVDRQAELAGERNGPSSAWAATLRTLANGLSNSEDGHPRQVLAHLGALQGWVRRSPVTGELVCAVSRTSARAILRRSFTPEQARLVNGTAARFINVRNQSHYVK